MHSKKIEPPKRKGKENLNLVARPLTAVKGKGGTIIYHNEKGESFRVQRAGGRKFSTAKRINLRVLMDNDSKSVLPYATAALFVAEKEKFIAITDLNFDQRFLKLDAWPRKPKESAKGRMIFRIFLNETIRVAREEGIKEIRITADNKQLEEYYKEFGFTFDGMKNGRMTIS